MVSNCCIRMLTLDFESNEIEVKEIELGYAKISYNSEKINLEKIKTVLKLSGLSLISNRDEKIVDDIKKAVIEMVHQMNYADSIVKKSEYIVEKLGLNYRYLSKLFSDYENMTLERFIILHKIERIKNLIDEEEYTLSEIAYMMDYSSVQYLSNQFKKETSYSFSEYKQLEKKEKKPLTDI